MTDQLARRERHALCDLALGLGPDVPTLCGGWTARDLVAHLLVRESSPLGAAGIVLPPLAGLTQRAMARASGQPFPQMVARLRDPGITPYRLRAVERLANTLEYFVHHEDLRRAQPGWSPRDLPEGDADELWRLLKGAGRLASRKVGVPLVIHRAGRTSEKATLRRGDDPVTVTGAPAELVLFFFGRDQVRDLTFEGPPDAVSRLRQADLGF